MRTSGCPQRDCTGEQGEEVPTIIHVVEIRECMAENADLVQRNAE